MIEALRNIFVTSPTVAEPMIRLAPQPRSVLVIDASGAQRLDVVAAATERLEPGGGRRVTFAPVALAGDSRLSTLKPDFIWIFVSATSDAAYCGLVARELADRFGVDPQIASFGPCNGLRIDCELEPVQMRGRRRARADAAARSLLECERAR